MKTLSTIPLSILDLCPIPQGTTPTESLHNTADLAQHAERWGYHRYWLAEHHGMPGIASAATSIVIAHVAQHTKTMRIGSGGIMLPNHAALVIAEQFGTLESLFPGRIDLGLGRAPGSNQTTARALRRSLENDDFPQQLAELRAYFEGRANVRAIPGEGLHIPIWLLGSSDFSAQLAAHLGLPFAFAGQFSPAYMQTALSLYRQLFQPSAVLAEPYAMVGVNVFAADTQEEAEFISSSHKQAHINLIRGIPQQLPPPVKDMDAIWMPQEKASVESTLRASVIGDPVTVKAGLQAFLDATQADELIVNSMIYEHKARLRSYEIVAQLRE